MDKTELDAVLNLSPKVNSKALETFGDNLHEAKKTYKVGRASMVRALIDKFNENPSGTLDYLGINKK